MVVEEFLPLQMPLKQSCNHEVVSIYIYTQYREFSSDEEKLSVIHVLWTIIFSIQIQGYKQLRYGGPRATILQLIHVGPGLRQLMYGGPGPHQLMYGGPGHIC
jgi:hypothetical protein